VTNLISKDFENARELNEQQLDSVIDAAESDAKRFSLYAL
jgi:hypothetical protein